ncbi:hypothetical protein B5X24_HaOG211289 [Helicoverpa armigera]|uniref:Uncharacterized protein n=1 Tax=Helicoverpa armigera TaxID=29058 RepID=A0A2W1BBF1_HELAM|nr:hypothetical protein B5X24_HaOG211289 [Helicoverpa armigera]
MVDSGKIFNELSWSVKLLLFKKSLNTSTMPGPTTDPIKIPVREGEVERRIPGIELLVAERRQVETTAASNAEDDNSMRLKLFRLMYETIRDSDLKCKRAELIRTHYVNSSVFEIGYLMGDVMDKFNIMSDISMTLNRLYHEWKPIEHINAYEQISNQAIEINHLIDLMRGISRKNETGAKYYKK